MLKNITIISNRLPVSPRTTIDGSWELDPSVGGLVSALDPILRQRGGRWLGWSGHHGDMSQDLINKFTEAGCERGYEMVPIPLSSADIEGYYNGFSNRAIWPLFHNLPGQCVFEPQHWKAYQRINRKFASALSEHANDSQEVWVHDYHLMMVARELRNLGRDVALGFFLHIPFPPPQTFAVLPWCKEILTGLMDYDLLGFQTDQDRDNFLECLTLILGSNSLPVQGAVTGSIQPKLLRNSRRDQEKLLANTGTKVGTFPISVDCESIEQLSDSVEVGKLTAHVSEELRGRKMIFGADRLDYTKGLLQRMKAYQCFLREHPELHGKVTFIQFIVPGRETIPEYYCIHQEIERLVGKIAGEFTQPGWVPLHYMYRKLSMQELVGYYRAADVALVTPVKDGMNLIAKEYCAARTDEDGVLILSDFAGAARELYQGAITINPYDEESLTAAIYKACTMDINERRSRMHVLHQIVKEWNVYDWVDAFLDTLSSVRKANKKAA